MRGWILALAVLFLTAPSQAQSAAPKEDVAPAVARGRDLTERFYKGELKNVWDNFSDEMRGTMSLDSLTQFRARISEQLGVESEILEEKTESRDGYRLYVRRVKFQKQEEDVMVMWAFRDDDKVAGFLVRLAAPPPPAGS